MAQLLQVEIPASHGRLEGLLREPDGTDTPPAMAALICHPHPQGGGTMHTKAVFRVAQALGEVGMPTLRFNFRGVGKSTGSYDEGRGEQDDVRAALDYLAARFPALPLCVAGVSFGSWVGLQIGCANARVQQLIGVGVPVRLLQIAALSTCCKPKLIVQGERDEYGPLDALQRWFADVSEPKKLVIVPESDHLFTRHQEALRSAIVEYFRGIRTPSS